MAASPEPPLSDFDLRALARKASDLAILFKGYFHPSGEASQLGRLNIGVRVYPPAAIPSC